MLVDKEKVKEKIGKKINHMENIIEEQLLPELEGQRWERKTQIANFKETSGSAKAETTIDQTIDNSIGDHKAQVKEAVLGKVQSTTKKHRK